jgi:predicted transposase/invertase (TIGR01784 family)
MLRSPFLSILTPISDSRNSFKNVEVLPDLAEERKAFFDIHCISKGGERFIVEMQKAKVKYFKDRSLFYTTFPIREQASPGGTWNFKLEPIYFIAILDFWYDESEELAKFRRDVSLKDQDCEEFFDKLYFKFLQMPAFKKTETELETHFDKWCYFLKNLESFNDIPQILREPIFEKAFLTARVANFSAAQRDAYAQSIMDYIGVREVAVTAWEDGREEGREVGLKEGREEGLKEGREEGREEGRDAREAELVLNPYKKGRSIPEIAMFLDIPEVRVQAIIAKYPHEKDA